MKNNDDFYDNAYNNYYSNYRFAVIMVLWLYWIVVMILKIKKVVLITVKLMIFKGIIVLIVM